MLNGEISTVFSNNWVINMSKLNESSLENNQAIPIVYDIHTQQNENLIDQEYAHYFSNAKAKNKNSKNKKDDDKKSLKKFDYLFNN
jgi:hypothetical protein